MEEGIKEKGDQKKRGPTKERFKEMGNHRKKRTIKQAIAGRGRDNGG